MGSNTNGASKTPFAINAKIILLSFLFLFLVLLVVRTTFPSSPQLYPPVTPSSTELTIQTTQARDPTPTDCPTTTTTPADAAVTCNKAPPSLALALVHYATTNITPQQTYDEVSVSLRVLAKKSPCNFLVFGLGHDSLMWTSLNHGGRTVFLEEDKAWIDQITQKLPTLEAFHVTYDTKVTQADNLMKLRDEEECREVADPRSSKCELAHKGFPSEVYGVEWDLIMVDAPTGWHDEAPGRMSAIYTAGLMARNRESGETDVFVHDVDRAVEDGFSRAFLCDGYLTEQVGRLRHFTVPSHRARSGRPFCP
ncbi:glucuronoxylan 4-O-methyltransferase 3-like [Syzygium oleosum]|uniref:glucuronoxylan 4-O-methyltransferase 3-like n=1 Tax=Syzygium oleosum TaxID=219896 RepID=UPI0011D272AF|nr:glucuronoxylan 4-O-methyltransferase 3-like [Syzygium oleosum]